MLQTIVLILLALWLIGLVADVAGSIIHLLLVIALVVLAYKFLKGRGRV